MKKELELYIHIPFCVRKCAYCDFRSAPAGREVQAQYVDRLLEEIQKAAPLAEDYEVVSAFFGGGTPSILPKEEIGRVMELLHRQFDWKADVEVTIEANPGTVDGRKLDAYRSFGINRISFGLQSADNEELQKLGRIHTWEQFLESYEGGEELPDLPISMWISCLRSLDRPGRAGRKHCRKCWFLIRSIFQHTV